MKKLFTEPKFELISVDYSDVVMSSGFNEDSELYVDEPYASDD